MSDTNCRRQDGGDLALVKGLCDGESTCEIDVSNGVFGDPCPGTYKYLEVTYKCIPGKERKTEQTKKERQKEERKRKKKRKERNGRLKETKARKKHKIT